jgi:GH43 family beta-xylosidase
MQKHVSTLTEVNGRQAVSVYHSRTVTEVKGNRSMFVMVDLLVIRHPPL